MSSDDEDLRRAIAISLEESSRPRHNTADDPIVISDDEDDEVTVLQPPPKPKPPLEPSASASENSSAEAIAGTSSFLSERAQLEAARLARLRARQATTSAPEPSKPKRERDPDDPFVSSDSDAPSQTKKFKPSTTNAYASGSSSRTTNGVGSLRGEQGPFYWDGELRQTANMYVDKDKDKRPVFRLTEILGNKSDLEFAIISSYVTDLAWIYSLFPDDVPVILVGQPGPDGAASVHNVLPNWVKVTPFLRSGRGCMHIKFLLLFYKSGRLRVVITTANFVDYDWRDIENSVWVQDIPPRSSPIVVDRKADDFAAQFERVLQTLHVAPGLHSIRQDHSTIPMTSISDLRCKWDFSKVKVELVPSLAGKYEGWASVFRVGHPRLMRAVRAIGARADPKKGDAKGKGKEIGRKIELESQGSSIGTYTPAWIEEFLCSARGASPEGWLDEGKGRRTKRLDGMLAQNGWKPWRELKIIFPSLQTVTDSRLGMNGAGTMFCQRRQWTGAKFPRTLFHDSNSKRGKILMHSKMILATFPDSIASSTLASSSKLGTKLDEPNPADDEDIQEVDPERNPAVLGWLYVGSHNFTPSAWGNLSGSAVSPSLNITNYELGIVLPITKKEQLDEWPCWVRPPRTYGKDDMPWMQEEYLV